MSDIRSYLSTQLLSARVPYIKSQTRSGTTDLQNLGPSTSTKSYKLTDTMVFVEDMKSHGAVKNNGCQGSRSRSSTSHSVKTCTSSSAMSNSHSGTRIGSSAERTTFIRKAGLIPVYRI
ncbi:uncharacterized protein LOC143022970 [Oratosquilla oratoria]|uniref:uncharacterized protein LOC143022970 n=1 Tax=Oratosquilla oratoria TaxID=337810 RepID=UPI003F764E3E